MLIGIDFDNTIICYDAVFHAVALERGLIIESVRANKQAVRDHLRRQGNEDEWTLMQGYVYGCRLNDAQPFPSVIDAIRQIRNANHDVAIVSHKTQHPYHGPPYDLHEAAKQWLRSQHIIGTGARAGTGTDEALIDTGHAYFEPTKQAKLSRIESLQCDHFIDDLPEFLAEDMFPSSTQRWLFDPSDANADCTAFRRLKRWGDFASQLLAEVVA